MAAPRVYRRERSTLRRLAYLCCALVLCAGIVLLFTAGLSGLYLSLFGASIWIMFVLTDRPAVCAKSHRDIRLTLSGWRCRTCEAYWKRYSGHHSIHRG
jgi:hypothetical protein